MEPGDKHLLRLIRQDRDKDGWARVSKQLWPLIEALPGELVERRFTPDGGFVKLTPDGETVLDWC